MSSKLAFLIFNLSCLIPILSACAPFGITPTTEPPFHVVADGLLGPLGLARLPDGSLLVAEAGTGQNDDSGGVSLVKPDGSSGRLISGLRSSTDAGDLAGVNTVALSPGGDKIYLGNFAQGHLWTLPLTAEQQQNGLAIPAAPLTTEQLTPAMLPLNNVRLINPFDLAFDDDGVPVVVDASGNGVAKELPDGTTRFFHRFDRLPDTSADSPKVTIDPVPTGLLRQGDEYYVTLLGGCPYPPQSGMLVAIDENRNQRTIVAGLNMPIDIAQGPDGTFWLLEFATFKPDSSCFSGEGYQPNSGRLSRLLPDGTLEPALESLNFPASLLPLPDGSLYISLVFDGQVVQVRPGVGSRE